MILPVILLSGCFKAPETIRDILELKQDHMFYIEKSTWDREILPPRDQKKMDDQFNARYFAPWHQTVPAYPSDKLTQTFEKYETDPGYGENKRKHKKSWIKGLRVNAQIDRYPNAGFAAIAVDNADLRVLPTHKPFYSRYNMSNGYPFDKFQESLISANTPLFISHMTKDRDWFLAETPYATGWISSRSVAVVDADFVKKWENGKYAVIIKDKTPVYDDAGRFLFRAPLGSLFPEVAEGSDSITIQVAVADVNNRAVIKKSDVRKANAATKPLKLNPFNMAKMANELINEPYGWGGLYQNRDCSAMMKDMYSPFGIWLPRNSADQAREGGTFIDLSDLSPEDREMMILKHGIPYLTLIWRKGHIMLYIGSYQGTPLIFHNFWSIRTKDFLGREDKIIVGHAAITTLQPGLELDNIDPLRGNYLNYILGMTLLINPEKQGALKP